MKKNLSSAFLTTIIVCGLLSVITLQLGMAVKIDSVANSGNTIISSPKSTPLQTPSSIAVTDISENRPLSTHDVFVRLPNGTLCATFCSNLLGINLNDAVYVVSSNDNGSTWGTPVKISNATGMINKEFNQGTLGPVIAADSSNNVYVAWTGVVEGETWQLWCTRYDGSDWSTPIEVSQGLEPRLHSEAVNIAVDGNNNVHLVWDSSMNGNETHDYEHNRIFYAEYNGSWSFPAVISTQILTPNFQFSPCIAVDSNNNLHVV